MSEATTPHHTRPIETLAGFLAAAAMAVALMGIAYRPVRLALPSLLIALACVFVGGRHQKLIGWAVGVTAFSWFIGMIVAVITQHPIW